MKIHLGGLYRDIRTAELSVRQIKNRVVARLEQAETNAALGRNVPSNLDEVRNLVECLEAAAEMLTFAVQQVDSPSEDV